MCQDITVFILNQGESYLSILLPLTTEAFEAYSTLIRSYWNTRFSKLITLNSQGRLDLMHMHTLFLNTFSKTCLAHQYLYPFYLLNISVSFKLNIKRYSPRHFLLLNKDNMFLVSKYKQIILLASSYRIRESRFLINYLIYCPLSSYSNSLSRYRFNLRIDHLNRDTLNKLSWFFSIKLRIFL
jgi:hypothetical protein